MGKVFETIDGKMEEWVARQRMFFVATAPRGDEGLVNCSPKGMDTFRLLDEHTVAYLDLTGSGVETIAHLRENGRIVIMLCALEGPPRIVRFHGRGEVHEKGSEGYRGLASRFADYPGARSIVRVAVERISDSCGYSVPLYSYEGERDILLKWAEQKGEAGVEEYQREKNRRSLDGLEGLRG